MVRPAATAASRTAAARPPSWGRSLVSFTLAARFRSHPPAASGWLRLGPPPIRCYPRSNTVRRQSPRQGNGTRGLGQHLPVENLVDGVLARELRRGHSGPTAIADEGGGDITIGKGGAIAAFSPRHTQVHPCCAKRRSGHQGEVHGGGRTGERAAKGQDRAEDFRAHDVIGRLRRGSLSLALRSCVQR